MANDLISREAALEAARAGLKNFAGMQWTPDTRQYVPKVVRGVRDALQNVPAIDAVPVVHARFVDGACTNCGWFGDSVETPHYNLCPGCGATTDLKEDDHGE